MYACGQRRYITFCASVGLLAVPAGEDVLCRFVAKMASEGLKHWTIKSYMAGIRHLHVEEGLGDPFLPTLPRLHYVLRGMKRSQGEEGATGRERLPITPPLLRRIKAVWDPQANDPDIAMLWAACFLAFFGFLRAGEFTVPCELGFDPSSHLSWGDLAVDIPGQPSVMSIRLKASKTDPFRKGITLFIGKVSSDLFPVSAMLAYLLVQGRQDGPLFRFRDGKPLTRQRFVSAVRDALVKVGNQAQLYAGHSFQIGAATMATARGMEYSVIKTLGRWKSLAYLEYIKIPRQQLATYSSICADVYTLCHPGHPRPIFCFRFVAFCRLYRPSLFAC